MSANDYLRSLAAEITGVSIDKGQLAGDGEVRVIDASGNEPRTTAREQTCYPARDDSDLIAPPPTVPDTLPD